MSDLYDRLLAAGAPRVEEPLFWRINTNGHGGLVVELRERTPKYGMPSVIRGSSCTNNYPQRPDEAVVSAMWRAKACADSDAELNGYIGDHSTAPVYTTETK